MSTMYQRPSQAWLRLLMALVALSLSLGLLSQGTPAAIAAPSFPAKKLAASAFTTGGWTGASTDLYSIPRQAGTSSAQQYNMIDTWVDIIKATQPGGTIRISMFSMSYPAVVKALSSARKRAVNVQFLNWDRYAKSAQMKADKKLLGTNTRKASFVKTCKGSCAADRGGTHHDKHMTSDRVKAPNGKVVRYVSVIGSGNLTYAAARDSSNSGQVIVGNKPIYDALNSYFAELVKDRTKKVKGKKYLYPAVGAGGYTLWRMPVGTNPMYRDLQSVSCKTSKGYGVKTTKGYRTHIQVAQFIWSGNQLKIAKQLAKLKRQGCVVEVAVTPKYTNKGVIKTLKKAAIPVWNTAAKKGAYNHAKSLLVDGKVYGKNRHWTYHGSTNLSASAITVNSDLIIRASQKNFVDHYRQWFGVLKGMSKRM